MAKSKRCVECGKYIFGNECNFCGTSKSQEKPRDFRNGLCHYNTYGEFCPLPGSCSTQIAGETFVFYCAYHVRCDDANLGAIITRWAKINFKEIIKARKNPLKYHMPKLPVNLKEWNKKCA